ncbi:MAG: HDIG domain-containing protein [Planctomycetes bacterium]|nr:HDIG domain-containing protein [Planctomycetota bacterium]
MVKWSSNRKIRRRQVREQRAKSTGTIRAKVFATLSSWPVAVGIVFCACASAIAIWSEARIDYSEGERIRSPIYARVDFEVRDDEQTSKDRDGARAATPSYYKRNASSLTVDRIRADLRSLYESAAEASSFEEYQSAIAAAAWPAHEPAYKRLRGLIDRSDDSGREQFETWIGLLPLESEYVATNTGAESREPKSTTDYLILQTASDENDDAGLVRVSRMQVVSQRNEKALRGSAGDVTRRFPAYELKETVEAIVFAVFRENPTIIFDRERTVAEMRAAEEATPVAMSSYEHDKPFIRPGVLGPEDIRLLQAEHDGYRSFLYSDDPAAAFLKREQLLRQVGLVTLVVLLSVGLLVYTKQNQPRIFENSTRTVAFAALMLMTLLAVRVLKMNWGQHPELAFLPCILSGSILAIVYPRRFAIGATCILAVLVAAIVQSDLAFLLALLTGVSVSAYQLGEIRTRTRIIRAGSLAAMAIMVASAAGGLLGAHSLDFVINHAIWAGGSALLASFILSGLLPFIERVFRIATSLTLLEWRDPTRVLLQLLAREAPGTYNHSLVLGTLAEAACERIGANGLLAQVGALYHDIGKIPKAEYFAENQVGQINRHDNLAPTMSLLIILGHVKDGIEMAKEYKVPRVLHQFIEEHHGTTVVRYFHHMASEKQPHISSGKHDREVPEAEFRYGGPKPRTRESAIVMLCDGVESAVRALPEPTVGRIESLVHQIVADRLSDGQLSDCDMTMRDVRVVEESLVKSLCSIYHGRVAYPKARKPTEEQAGREKVSV